MAKKALRDIVVFLPGITGSVLQKDGKDVWNVSAGSILNALLSLGQNVKDLALTEDPPDVDDLGDGVTAPRVMRDVHLIPGLWKIDGYSRVLQYVTDTFDAKAGENFFEFPYDWRRDNRVAARRLARQTEDWLASWRDKSGATDAKVILVGHSMGGIISRYYLECLDGWRNTRALITFGTPYSGSLNAVGTLVNGMKKKIGPIEIDLSDLARSFTAIYQLLPTYACYRSSENGKLVRIDEATIPHIDPAKAKAAAKFHDEIRDAVAAHEKDDEYRQNRYDIRPVVGILQPTNQSVRATGSGITLMRELDGNDAGGDGTVPRVSATPAELQHEANAMFASERHASLQNEEAVLVQMRGVISGLDVDFPSFRGAFPTIGLGLEIEDSYVAGEPISVRARPEEEPGEPLLVNVVNVETDEEVASNTLRDAGDGWYEAEIRPPAEGAYRVTAYGSGRVEPVTDLFLVLGEAD
jgi:pimeloyl-ACP methyl ester carboxylesterase